MFVMPNTPTVADVLIPLCVCVCVCVCVCMCVSLSLSLVVMHYTFSLGTHGKVFTKPSAKTAWLNLSICCLVAKEMDALANRVVGVVRRLTCQRWRPVCSIV